jgi:hypothetical protein
MMHRRAGITWLIGGAVVVLLVLAGVDALRSGRSEASPPTSLTEILSPPAPTESSTQITPADTSVAETPVAETSTQSSVPPQSMHITAQGGTPRHANYAKAALAVCAAASSELFKRANATLLQSAGWMGGKFSLEEMENIWQWNSVAAKMETRSLKRLDALPAPHAEQKLISEFFRAAEDERDLLREVAGAAAADYPELLRVLGRKRVDATHRKDGIVARISARWHLDPEPLRACPLMLPA